MSGQLPVCGELGRQVTLQLNQGERHADATLAGDILSQDCLVLATAMPFACGETADLFVRFLAQSFHVSGLIKRCDAADAGQFLVVFQLVQKDNHLQTRMLLQLSKVEQYRQDMALEGRLLSMDEAACEWVSRFAEQFAGEFDA
ncbi:MAG TPA: hypothetical protein VIN71_02440 [Pseudomonadales bacterium]